MRALFERLTARRIRLVAAVSAVIATTGCGLQHTIADTSALPMDHRDQSIATLADQSSSWQATLTQLETQLNADAETLLANEVAQVAAKGIATAGTEIRCDTDFIRRRMR